MKTKKSNTILLTTAIRRMPDSLPMKGLFQKVQDHYYGMKIKVTFTKGETPDKDRLLFEHRGCGAEFTDLGKVTAQQIIDQLDSATTMGKMLGDLLLPKNHRVKSQV